MNTNLRVLRRARNITQVQLRDDGECIYLDKVEENQKVITSNYGVVKKVSKSVDYQYILNMNYTVCWF